MRPISGVSMESSVTEQVGITLRACYHSIRIQSWYVYTYDNVEARSMRMIQTCLVLFQCNAHTSASSWVCLMLIELRRALAIFVSFLVYEVHSGCQALLSKLQPLILECGSDFNDLWEDPQ